MRFRVKLFRGTNRIIVNGDHLCLGHLVLMMHTAALSNIQSWQQLIDLAEEVFDRFDGTTPADNVLPAYDRAFHFKFNGCGAWGALNVSGMLEMLFRGNEFLQAGIQAAVQPVLLFGAKRSLANVVRELSTAVQVSYDQSLSTPQMVGPATMSQISDSVSHAYLSVMQAAVPIVTFRIGNRAIWGG
jgi:hypothetical protein